MRDLQAAIAADAIPILVRTGKGEATYTSGDVPAHVQVFDSLYDAVDRLLSSK